MAQALSLANVVADCCLSMPRISQHELHGTVDPRVLGAQRGVRQVIDLRRKVDRVALTMEPLRAQLGPAGEVNLRGVARGKILGAEYDPTDGSDVRRHLRSTSEIPLGNEGVDGAGILRPVNPEFVQGDDIHRHLEAAAKGVLAKLVRQHPPDAPSDEEALRAGSVGERLAAPDEQSFVPSGTAEHLYRVIGWRLRQQRGAGKETEQNEANGGLHWVVRVNAKVIRLGLPEQISRTARPDCDTSEEARETSLGEPPPRSDLAPYPCLAILQGRGWRS